MENWQTGDIYAFEAMYHQYERLVFKNAYLITGSRDEAQDVLQQVFVSVWKSRRTFNPDKGKLTTWLHRITVNECMKKSHRPEPVAAIFANMRIMDTVEDPGDMLMKHEQYEKLIGAINKLDQKHRAILVLRYFNDLSYEDIARTSGIPLGTVKSRINNGLKMLRVQMSEQVVAGGECE
jgi:RNA polymerase sigma factor (sigma-70 family)